MTAFLGLIMVTVFFGIRKAEERRALLVIAVSSYLFKAALVPLYYWLLWEVGAKGFAFFDSRGYHHTAMTMATEIINDLPHDNRGWISKDPGYSYVSAMVYVVFGTSTLICRFLNCVIASFTLLYVYRIGVICFDKRVAKIAVRFAAFIPFTILQTINHQKEAIVVFLATMLFYYAIRILSKEPGRLRCVPLLMASLVSIYYFRSGFVLVYLGLFLAAYVVTQRSIIEGTMVTIFMVGLLAVSQVLFPHVKQLDVEGQIQAKMAVTEFEATYHGGLLGKVKVTSIGSLWKAPIGAGLMVVMPFPPRHKGMQTFYSTLQSVAQLAFLLFLPRFVLGIRESFRSDTWKKSIPILIFASGFLLVLATLTIGVMRYRETVFPLVLLVTAAGYRVPSNFLLSGAIYFGLASLAGIVYLNRAF
jgi:4-amino-4-deoxy-L-arabinose transferase-like glycosyltransferase